MFNDLTWKESEQKVQQYMKNKGFKILETNFEDCLVTLSEIEAKIKQENIKKN